MKTRNSSGVGQKIDLEFDIDNLRIRDMNEDDDYQQFSKQKSTVFDQIKRQANTQSSNNDTSLEQGDTVGKIKAQTDSSKLKDFLNTLNTEE